MDEFVPDFKMFINRKVHIDFARNIPILSLRTEPLENLLNIAHDDGDLKKLADDNTLLIKQRLSTDSMGVGCFDAFAKELCLAYGLRYPKEFEIQGQIMRLQCSAWWLRGLRNSHARAREVAAINAGLVHKKAALYCSDDTLERRTEQNKRNADMLAGVTMQSESGQKMNLADLAAKGMANPYNRAVELITRTKGFQELADKYQHKCLFLTITTPSRMHAFKHNGKQNKKYDGTKPDEAQRYLTGQWAKCRARLARENVEFYGLRVVEPHHDATPHWHAAVWVQSDTDLHKMRRAVKDYFLRAQGCDYLEKGSIAIA